jgi:hypothetical protein
MPAMADHRTDANDAAPRSSDGFEVHRQMVTSLFVATLGVSVLMTLGLLYGNVRMLMAVAAAGALGGFVSALRRLYSFQRVFPTDFFKTARHIDVYLLIYAMIPSLVGVIAAVVLYLLFASAMVEGTLFPHFEFAPPPAIRFQDTFKDFVENWQPASATDYAKALVWAFIAGFSERFVPDLLRRFGEEQPAKPEAQEQSPAQENPAREEQAVGVHDN